MMPTPGVRRQAWSDFTPRTVDHPQYEKLTPVSIRTQATSMLRQSLQSRHLPWCLAVLAMALCAPSLLTGLQLDDDFHRIALTRSDLPLLSRSPAELFVFIEGDKSENRQFVLMGMLPWWSHEELRIAFFRPLTGLTHWLDYRLWPDHPFLMHLQSLAWLGGAVLAAALFYRRMLSSAWVAGLAALLFAVDDAHGLPAIWLANRNALLAILFGLLALIAHDRWRKDGSRLAALLAPLMLMLGLLSKESTAAIGAYILAYALFLDRGSRSSRFVSLLPCAVTGVVWWAYYKAQGYAAVGSGWYLDPVADPWRFLHAFAERAPALLAWQWLIPADLEWTLDGKTAHLFWIATMGFLLIIAAALARLVWRDRVARFWALGMALSIPPACTAYPDERLLAFAGIGGMGLLAQLIAAALRNADPLPAGRWRRLPVRTLCLILVIVHLGVAPVTLARMTGRFNRFADTAGQAAASLPSDPAARFQTTLIVSTPSFSTFVYSAMKRMLQGDPYLSRTLVLGSGGEPIEIHRVDKRTLRVRPKGGYLARVGGRGPGGEIRHLLFDQRSIMHSLDRLYRDDRPMKIGQRIGLMGVTAKVTAVTSDGRPVEAEFRFAFALESSLFRWLQWQEGAYVPFELPAVGETVTLPAATLPVYGNKPAGSRHGLALPDMFDKARPPRP